MAALQDIKLTLSAIGTYYDITVADNGDIETEDSFDSAIIASLFTDARASSDQVVIPERRRGWIGNANSDFKLGSTIWVYGQLRNRSVELNELAFVAKLALQHFKDDGRVNEITTSMIIEDKKAYLTIRMERPNNKVDVRYYELWNNTGT